MDTTSGGELASTYFEECLELDLDYVEEAGGLVSWFKRKISGVDMSLRDEVLDELRSIRSEEDKRALLDEIDALIVEARSSRNDGYIGDVARAVAIGTAGGFAGAAIGTVRRSAMVSGKKPPNVESLWFERWLGVDRAKQNAADTTFYAQKTSKIIDGALKSMAYVGIGAALLTLVMRTVNRATGRMESYLDVLVRLRREIADVGIG
jgi:hypothetical protein